MKKKKGDAYNWSLGDIVEEDEVAEHGDEAEETESSHNVDHCVLQVKFSWKFLFSFRDLKAQVKSIL